MCAEEPLVSVIVPVRDNGTGIRDVLRCLERQTLSRDRFEVIVADDGSRHDPLMGIWSDLHIRPAHGPARTSYAARNRGIAAARADALAFCDSDCQPEPEWLERGLAALEDKDLVAGRIALSPPDPPTVWSLLTLDSYLDQCRAVGSGTAATANLFIRRPLLERVGGFDESLPSGGDWELVRRAVAVGASLAYEPAAVVRHPTLDSAGALLGKVWRVNRWSAARRARDGISWAEEQGHLLAALVPAYGTACERRRTRRRLTALELGTLTRGAGSAPARQRLAGIIMVYALLAPTTRLAQIHGRLTRTGPTRCREIPALTSRSRSESLPVA